MKTEKDFANSPEFHKETAEMYREQLQEAEAKVKALKKILEEVEADRVSLIGDGFLGDKISAKVAAILTEKNL